MKPLNQVLGGSQPPCPASPPPSFASASADIAPTPHLPRPLSGATLSALFGRTRPWSAEPMPRFPPFRRNRGGGAFLPSAIGRAGFGIPVGGEIGEALGEDVSPRVSHKMSSEFWYLVWFVVCKQCLTCV